MFWRLGVVGSPIAHSLSPALHRAGLAALGLEGDSERFEVGLDQATHLGELLGARVDALSVTMPLKSLAAQMCDDLDPVAARLGVVSSLWWRDGRLAGLSSDGPGFLDALRGELGVEVAGREVVVMGTGGAATSIVDSLVADGARVSVLSRSAASAEALCQRFSGVRPFTHDTRVDLVVNTTPSASREETTLLEGVSETTVAVDITYEPARSPWLEAHAARGCVVANGLAMLAYQAARQMNWWWGASLDGSTLLQVIS